MGNSNPTPEHQRLVAALIVYFRDTLHYNILSTAYSGFIEPANQGRHEPDIIAKDQNGILHIAEAKLGQDFLTQRTREQFIDFSNRVMLENNIAVPFHIIVYKTDHAQLLSVLNSLGLYPQIGNRIKIWTL